MQYDERMSSHNVMTLAQEAKFAADREVQRLLARDRSISNFSSNQRHPTSFQSNHYRPPSSSTSSLLHHHQPHSHHVWDKQNIHPPAQFSNLEPQAPPNIRYENRDRRGGNLDRIVRERLLRKHLPNNQKQQYEPSEPSNCGSDRPQPNNPKSIPASVIMQQELDHARAQVLNSELELQRFREQMNTIVAGQPVALHPHPLDVLPAAPTIENQRYEAALETHNLERLAMIEDAKRTAAHESQNAVDLLQEENVRLAEAKSSTELAWDKQRIESIQLKNQLSDAERESTKSLREAQIECEAKDRLSQRLLAELHEAQGALASARNQLKKTESSCAETQSALVESCADYDTQVSCNKNLTEKLAIVTDKKIELEKQVGHEKRLRTKSSKAVSKMIEIISEMYDHLDKAQQLRKDCSARGYFATRSQKVHDCFEMSIERLQQVATEMHDGQGRKEIMTRINKIRNGASANERPKSKTK